MNLFQKLYEKIAPSAPSVGNIHKLSGAVETLNYFVFRDFYRKAVDVADKDVEFVKKCVPLFAEYRSKMNQLRLDQEIEAEHRVQEKRKREMELLDSLNSDRQVVTLSDLAEL